MNECMYLSMRNLDRQTQRQMKHVGHVLAPLRGQPLMDANGQMQREHTYN
jgi:hypothetical protein